MISHNPSAAFTSWPWLARSRLRQLVLVLLALAGLLVTFHRVVSSSVRQGAERRAESAAHADATWRCKSSPRSQAGECLVRVAAQPR